MELDFMDVEDGHLTQKRFQNELKKSVELVSKRRAAGTAGGRVKALKNNAYEMANATVLPKQNPAIQIQIQIQEKKK